ncbi:hypothetical protein V6N13_116669 [Hibiscus sabdariffa]
MSQQPPPRSASVHAPSRSVDQLSPFHIRPGRIAGPHPLPCRKFQALFDSLYKVLFIFPSRAAFPNNPTRRRRLVVRQGPGTTGLSPSPAPLSRGLGLGPPLRTLLQTTIRTPRVTDSQAGLFPVRSPLLRESLCESRDIRCRESFCVFTTKWARLRRTRTANGGATTDGHLFIPIPWRNSRRGLFVLPWGHGFPCHPDRVLE